MVPCRLGIRKKTSTRIHCKLWNERNLLEKASAVLRMSRVMQHYRMIHSYAYKGFNFDFHSVSSEYWFFFSLDQLRFRYYSCIGWSTAIHTEVPVLNMFQLNSVFRVSPSQLYVTFIRWLHKIHKRRYFFSHLSSNCCFLWGLVV